MGRQVNFFLHPDDQSEFDLVLRSIDDVLFLPYYHPKNEISTLPDSIIRDIKKEGSRVYLVRPSDFSQMKLEHIEKFGYWLIKENELPVLHFDRCYYKTNEIYRGRLYFQPKYIKNMRWAEKPVDFVKWADNVIKMAKRKLKKHTIEADGWSYQEYVGKNAAIWIELNKPTSQMGGASIRW